MFLLGSAVYFIFFVREKGVRRSRTKTLTKTLRAVKKMLQVTTVIKMVIILVVVQVFISAFSKSVELKFIENGVDKASLANIQSGVLPFRLILLALVPFFADKSLLMRQVLGLQLGTVLGALILLVLAWRLSNGYEDSSGWMMLGFFLRDFHSLFKPFFFSKVTEVIPEEIGATGYTIFAVFSNMSHDIPSSICLKVADLVSERRLFQLVLASIFLQFVAIFLLWPLAAQVDEAKIEEFRIDSETELQERYSPNTSLLEVEEGED